MSGSIREHIANAYNPTVESSLMLLSGACFGLMMFLNSPDFSNPYYVFGVGTMAVSAIVAIVMFVSARRSQDEDGLQTATADREDWEGTTPSDAGDALFGPRRDE